MGMVKREEGLNTASTSLQMLFHKLEKKKKAQLWELPDGLVVRILGFHYHGLGSVLGWGTEIPPAVQPKKNTDFPSPFLVLLTPGLSAACLLQPMTRQ